MNAEHTEDARPFEGRIFTYTTEYHAVVEAWEDGGITITDLPISLSSSEAENLAVGLARAAQWLRMVEAGWHQISGQSSS